MTTPNYDDITQKWEERAKRAETPEELERIRSQYQHIGRVL